MATYPKSIHYIKQIHFRQIWKCVRNLISNTNENYDMIYISQKKSCIHSDTLLILEKYVWKFFHIFTMYQLEDYYNFYTFIRKISWQVSNTYHMCSKQQYIILTVRNNLQHYDTQKIWDLAPDFKHYSNTKSMTHNIAFSCFHYTFHGIRFQW